MWTEVYAWTRFRPWIIQQLVNLTGRSLAILFAAYAAFAWLCYWAAGEEAIYASATDFIYFLIVTTSTVGYGDMSPETVAGKWVTLLYVIPAGLGLFAIVIGQLAGFAASIWRAGITGKRGVNVKDHIVILGWNGQRTLDLIRMIQHGKEPSQSIVLCVRPEMENPLPSEIGFVRTETFTNPATAEKLNLRHAKTILVDNPEDDITLSATLYCSGLNTNAHILAYFHDEALVGLAKQHCPNVECIPSVSAEMMAKAAIDPGSSSLHHELLSTDKGMTQYALQYPTDLDGCLVRDLFDKFKSDYNATIIGLINPNGPTQLNPTLETQVESGARLFYIADDRITNIQW
uniref:ion channel n=1 Tax=Thaumasiovibrio occultus TaxID=1891184 RepID=UPI000B34E1EF|nr:ion channel [Thaumasiovibrio occultus]